MSKLTLEEAISHCLEVAEKNETQAEKWREEGGEEWGKTTACRECAAEHRQLAEWLTDYKELKNSIGAVKLSNMKEALKLIRAYKAENIAQKKLIAEYKRLLKAAVNDLRWLTKWHDPCELCGIRDDDGDCPVDLDKGIDCDDIYMWRLETEVIKLIGEEGKNNGTDNI